MRSQKKRYSLGRPLVRLRFAEACAVKSGGGVLGQRTDSRSSSAIVQTANCNRMGDKFKCLKWMTILNDESLVTKFERTITLK
jgi:hypothetical protein